jgi:hypothetical protein
MEKQRPWISSLAHAGMLVNILLQRGQQGVTFKDVYGGIRSGELWKDLEQRFPGFDTHRLLTESGGPQPELVIESLAQVVNDEGFEGNEERDYGIADGNGLSLLLSLVLSAMQSKLWEDPPDRSSWKQGPPPPRN